MAKPFLFLQIRPEDETSNNEYVAFLKAGNLRSQDTRRIRIEQEGVPSIDLNDYSAVVVGGGPFNVSDTESLKPENQRKFESGLESLLSQIINRDFPFLGACYGLGILNKFLGGEVSNKRYAENVEATTIAFTKNGQTDTLLSGLPEKFRAFGGHKESCQTVAPGAVLLASSETCPIHMIRYKTNIYATQFHPELEKEGLELRIRFYKDLGYFPPEDADKLIVAAEKESVTVPMQIMARFVSKYLK